VTLLRFGKNRDVYLTIRLRASFTEIGTLELWCESRETPHRWRLQFELRGEEAQVQQLDTVKPQPVSAPSSRVTTSEANVESAAQLIKNVLAARRTTLPWRPSSCRSNGSGARRKKDSWPLSVIRQFSDALIELPLAQKSPRHEMRWLNLSGFCLRPGFGAPGDDALVKPPTNHRLEQPCLCRRSAMSGRMLVLLRRIVAHQCQRSDALYRKHTSPPGVRRSASTSTRVREVAPPATLTPASQHPCLAGHELVAKIRKEPRDAICLGAWPAGARIPCMAAALVVEPEIAGEWLKVLLDLSTFTEVTGFRIVLIARRTDDPSRDIDDVISCAGNPA